MVKTNCIITLTFIFLLFGGRSQALPRQGSGDKVHKNVSQGFHVIPPALFNTQMRIDASIPSGSSQILILSVGNVLMGARIAILFGQTKVNNVYEVSFLPQTPEKMS